MKRQGYHGSVTQYGVKVTAILDLEHEGLPEGYVYCACEVTSPRHPDGQIVWSGNIKREQTWTERLAGS